MPSAPPPAPSDRIAPSDPPAPSDQIAPSEPAAAQLDAPQAVARALHATGRGEWRIVGELEGGASTRRFFRVRPPSGETWIAMFLPAPSQELHRARQAPSAAFVEVQDLLRERGVAVPRLLADLSEHRVLLVEDLGDDTLAVYLEREPEKVEALYRRAVCDLAAAQESLDSLPEHCSVARRCFDAELLSWELEHFRDWALTERGIELSASDSRTLDRSFEYLATSIARWPRSFVHRDYQSRNLMVRDEDGTLSLTWIDFQDAMLGPRTYDLVALLMDSYQNFSRRFIEDKIHLYAQVKRLDAQLAEVSEEFDLVTVQRKLKDAGRFVFIDRVNGNPSFLKFVEPTIDRAIAALERLRHHPPLFELKGLLEGLPSEMSAGDCADNRRRNPIARRTP